MISPGKPKVFTAGAIVDNPDDLLEGQTYWFYLFKVAVGKSFCHRRREDEKKQDEYSKIPLPPNYDSVYLEGESPRKYLHLTPSLTIDNMFQHKYLIYNRDQTLLTYAVQTKIRIDDQVSFKDVRRDYLTLLFC